MTFLVVSNPSHSVVDSRISSSHLPFKTEETQFCHLSMEAMWSRSLYLFFGLLLVLESDPVILMMSYSLQCLLTISSPPPGSSLHIK